MWHLPPTITSASEKTILILTQNSHFTTSPWCNQTHVHWWSTHTHTHTHTHTQTHYTTGLWLLCAMCERFLHGDTKKPDWGRFVPPPPSVTQRHGRSRIRVDSCWCALHFMSVLRGEICKRDRHRKPPERERDRETETERETCSWPEINTVTGTISATTHAALDGTINSAGQPQRLDVAFRASCHAGLIRGLYSGHVDMHHLRF